MIKIEIFSPDRLYTSELPIDGKTETWLNLMEGNFIFSSKNFEKILCTTVLVPLPWIMVRIFINYPLINII